MNKKELGKFVMLAKLNGDLQCCHLKMLQLGFSEEELCGTVCPNRCGLDCCED